MDLLSTVIAVLVSLFAIITIVVLVTGVFNQIPLKIGFRNISRRLGNTALVIIGSLVGSALIAGSLVMADSMDATFKDMVYRLIGENDATISFSDKTATDMPFAFVTSEEYEEIKKVLENDQIDGIVPAFSIQTSPVKLDSEGKPVINAYNVSVVSYEYEDLKDFGEEANAGIEYLKDLQGNEVLVDKSLAKQLELAEGDTIRAVYGPSVMEMKVDKIFEGKGVLGGGLIIANPEYLMESLGFSSPVYNGILVSAKGGVEPKNYDGQKFKQFIEDTLKNVKNDRVDFKVSEWKADALDGYGMKVFSIMFLAMSSFGILSGILLIVNLYMMLAEERKKEHAILRAIAFTRSDLVKIFTYEGYLYSILSSLAGSAVGIGIGYILIFTLGKMFASLTGGTDFLRMQFGLTWQSLVIAFLSGFLITMITVIGSSIKMSGLNIVSAIRNLKEEKKKEKLWKWVLKTVFIVIVFLAGLLMLWSSTTVGDSLREMRNQGGNPLAEMDQKVFDNQVILYEGHLLYIGFVISTFVGVAVVNRIVEKVTSKDIRRFTLMIAGIANIVFSGMLGRIDSIAKTLNMNEGTVLFFVSGVVLIVSMSMIVALNLDIITKFLSWVLSPIKILRPVVHIAFRYPASKVLQTGITFVTFALVIFLIVYIGLIKATIREEQKKAMENAFGGYNLVIYPSPDMDTLQVNEMKEVIVEVENIEKAVVTETVTVRLADIKYVDLPQSDYYGDPRNVPTHNEDETFISSYNAFPADFIGNIETSLSKRAEGYETDDDVWQAVAEDNSKVVLGEAFAITGYGQQPQLKVGDKIRVSDYFGEQIEEKEVIGIVDASSNTTGPGNTLLTNIIVSSDTVNKQFTSDYRDKFAQRIILSQFKSGEDTVKITNSVKKALIEYNVLTIIDLDSIVKSALSFIDMFMLMFQGFLAFGLIVGTSGLAIIITRSVNERRQQIGMLRSLGYQKWMILCGFFIESTFITLLGIAIGVSMGIVGALVAFDISYQNNANATPVFPVTEIVIVCVAVYIASMIFSLLPSLRAASLKPVEATSYAD